MATKLTKQAQLEGLFRTYSDLPPEAIIKEDLLNEGVAIPPSPANGDVAKDLAVEGGPYDLRRTIVRLRVHPKSPYLLKSVEGRWVIADRGSGSPLADAKRFPDDNGYARRTCASGTACGDIVDPDGEVVVFAACQLSGEERCRLRSPGPPCESIPSTNPAEAGFRDPAQVADAIGELFVGAEWDPRERPINVKLTGGCIVGQLAGKTEEDFYLQYVVAIKSVLRNRYPLLLEMFPKPRNVEASLRREGVNGRLSNLGIWDRELFRAWCPGKERLIGWEEWVRRLIDQVDVYGQGHVLPGIIVGLEMAGPWGQSSLSEAVRTTSKAFEFLMLHGVTPRPIHMWLGPDAGPGGKQPPPVELFLETDRAWYETWQKYWMSEPAGYRMGPGRTRFAESAAFDVGRGTPLTPRKNEDN